MDVDGQDPVSIIPKMIEKWNEGYDVVYGKRLKGENNFINKITAKIGMYLVSKLSYLDIPTNVGEFRLMDRKLLKKLKISKTLVLFYVEWSLILDLNELV